jgi:hypothetical protein
VTGGDEMTSDMADTRTEPHDASQFSASDDPLRIAVTGELKGIGGSNFDAFNLRMLEQLTGTAWLVSGQDANQASTAQIAALAGAAPSDELEGMLAAQLVATHNAAMECYRRAMLREQTSQARDMNLTQANKLTRSYATLLQALDKRRGRGQQKVTVEHVYVGEGGQAIIGHVEAGLGGRSSVHQPPARLQHAMAIPLDVALQGASATEGVGR